MLLDLSPAYLVFGLFIVTLIGLIRFQNRPERVFGALLLALYSLNLVSSDEVIASIANEGLLTLVLLMVCSLALEKTSLLRRLTVFVIKPSYRQSWWRLFGLTTLSSALLNNTAVVSTMLAPIRNNPHHAASRLLLPLSYAAILGGTLTLVGTSTNLIVNSMMLEAGLAGFHFFDFTLIGSLLVLCCGALLFFLSHQLPQHQSPPSLAIDYFIDAKVQPDSVLVGKSIEANGLRNLECLFLVEIIRQQRLISPVSPNEFIEADDRLVFSGDVKKVNLLKQFEGLSLYANENGLPLDNLTEVIIRPESFLVGKCLKRIGFRALFDAAVVAIKRDGEPVSGKLGEVSLKSGDALILAVGDDFKSRRNLQKNFFLLMDLEADQLLTGWREAVTILGFVGAISAAALSWLSLFQGMLLLLGGLLFSGCLNRNEVLPRLPMQIWLIIASALLLSQAFINTNALSFLETWLAISDGDPNRLNPLLALVMIYLATWLLTELVTNNASAALMFPIAYGVAVSLEANVHSFIYAVAFGASASFISPYGYQTNLMVYNAGQYRLADFARLGVPMAVLYGMVTIVGIVYFYGL